MKIQFDVLRKSRALVLKELEGLTLEQLHAIPEGLKNKLPGIFPILLVPHKRFIINLWELIS